MAEWRLGRGWSDAELLERLARARDLPHNFSEDPEEMTVERGWNHYFSEAVVGREAAGTPVSDGPFEKGRVAVTQYVFSDPTIVVGHFDPRVPLLHRPMLLELRALRHVRFLVGVRVGAVRDEQRDDRSVFGWRYDTLEGHIEMGSEWFLLTKDHVTGKISFRIEADWLPGQFPNWWSRVGFMYMGPSYQKKWHRRAHGRLHDLMRAPDPAAGTDRGHLAHTGPEMIFQRFPGQRPEGRAKIWREEDVVESR